MERHEQMSLLNRAWLVAEELIKEHKNSTMAVDALRLQNSIEHIEQALGWGFADCQPQDRTTAIYPA
jgi:hypothetical protein